MPRLPFQHTPNMPSPTRVHRDGSNVNKRAASPRPIEIFRGHTTFHTTNPDGSTNATRANLSDYPYMRDDD